MFVKRKKNYKVEFHDNIMIKDKKKKPSRVNPSQDIKLATWIVWLNQPHNKQIEKNNNGQSSTIQI